MLRILTLLVAVCFSFAASAAAPTEQEKIAALLNAFDSPDITLIRNGEEHDGAWAKKHFEEKLKETKPEVTTADEFIEKVGTESSHTGKPYQIKIKNGMTLPSAVWLRSELALFNSKHGDK